MKLIVSSSLGQAWLVNHPKCRLDNDQEVVYFTQCADCPELDKASYQIFSSWYASCITDANMTILPRTMSRSQDINFLVLSFIDSLMVDGAQRKTRQRNLSVSTTKPTAVTKSSSKPSAREQRAAKRLRASNTEATEDPPQTPLSTQGDQCNRTATHPLHTISTTIPPKTIDQWPPLQSSDDIPTDMPRVPPE
jgi:hypothetical protein